MHRPSFAGIWREDERARAAYSEGAGIYRILPRAIAVPSTTPALAALVCWAGAEGIPLVPRGAGSGMPGGNVGEGVVIDLTVLDGAPISVDTARCLATTGAAVSLGALREAAGRQGLRMPVDPSSERFATVGGAVATNAAGTRTVKYGPVRRWVQGLSLVTADGEVVALERGVPIPACGLSRRLESSLADALRLARWRVAASFPKVRKNTAGYALDQFLASGDLLDLVIGSEGTLGIVTEVRWRLEPIPPHRGGLRAALRDAKRLGILVPALLELEPSRVEFLDQTFLGFIGDELGHVRRGERLREAGAVLMVEFEGHDPAAIEQSLERAVGIVRSDSLEEAVGADEREVESLWAIRHAASPKLAALGNERRSLQVVEDGTVPVERLGDYLAMMEACAARRGVPIVMFGHAGDGNVHANLLPDVTKPGWEDQVRAVFEDQTHMILSLGGTTAGEHGDGRLRAGVVERIYGFEMTQVFRQIKRAFDPAGIMNPGVKLGDGGDPIRSLKAGGTAPSIPADIEAGLRRLERQAGYSTARLDLADDPLIRSAE